MCCSWLHCSRANLHSEDRFLSKLLICTPLSWNAVAFRNREEVVFHRSRLVIGRFKVLCEQHVARRLERNTVDQKHFNLSRTVSATTDCVTWEIPVDISNRKENVAHNWHPIVKLAFLIQCCCAHRFVKRKPCFNTGGNCLSVGLWLLFCKYLRKTQMVMKVDNTIVDCS